MIAIVCCLAVGIIGYLEFTQVSEADPSEVTHEVFYTVRVCVMHGDTSTTVNNRLTYASGWHEGDHWSGSNSVARHDVTVIYDNHYRYEWSGCHMV